MINRIIVFCLWVLACSVVVPNSEKHINTECSEGYVLVDTCGCLQKVPTAHLHGQSNAVSGTQNGDSLTATQKLPIPDIYIHSFYRAVSQWETYWPDRFGNATPNAVAGGNNVHGLEYSFMQQFLASEGQPVYLFKNAVGATSLWEDWAPDGQQWLDFVTDYQLGKDQLIADGKYPDNKYFIWWQGENDASTAINPNAGQQYQANLANLVQRVRLLLGAQVKFVLVRIGPINANYTQVNSGIDYVAANDVKIETCDALPYYDIPSNSPDNIHLVGPRLLDMGECAWSQSQSIP